jgi:hypothetical protein
MSEAYRRLHEQRRARADKRGNPSHRARRNPSHAELTRQAHIANPYYAVPASWGHYRGTLYVFQFGHGTYSNPTYVAFWDEGHQGIEGALYGAAEWLAEYAPGHLVEPDYEEAARELGMPSPKTVSYQWDDEAGQAILEQAELNLTYTESGWLESDQWFVNTISKDLYDYAVLFERSVDQALKEDLDWIDDEYIEQANKIASELGIEARWEIE